MMPSSVGAALLAGHQHEDEQEPLAALLVGPAVERVVVGADDDADIGVDTGLDESLAAQPVDLLGEGEQFLHIGRERATAPPPR